MELVVRDGKFFTIGDQGAEFFQYKPQDIIFNARQTQELFKYGGIKGAKPRGTVLASGSAFASGSLPSDGLAFSPGSSGYGGAGPSGSGSSSSSSSSSKSSKSSKSKTSTTDKDTEKANKTAKDFKETFDWIEVKIKRLEQALDSLGRKADSVYRSWGTRNKNLGKSITQTNNMIKLQEKAANRYLVQANKVNLSEKWRKKVRNGTIDINNITDEKLAERIKKYQEWYEKYKDCKIAADEYRESLKKLYSQKFDNIMTQFDAYITDRQHNITMLEERISQAEAKGQIVNAEYYKALTQQKNAELETLKKERQKLIAARDAAVADGAVTKYSEEWYRMTAEIDSCTEAIEEGETAILEYAKAIREIEWETWDLILDRIQLINDEADFLIELMSRKKLYNDDGSLTDEGWATMGLYAQKYNTHMEKALELEKQIAELDKQIAEDPTNNELREKRNELEADYWAEMLAAEDVQESMADLAEECINQELEALEERIDKYKESLEAQKDLYDYQKKVKEQTKEIASLEKQMAAYAGDDSEEAKAKIQELKVSLEEAKADLEETEYDKYISDQEELLDDLYTEYEELLNARLDDSDQLLKDIIGAVNGNSSKIGKTLEALANSIGYDISNETNSIWNNNTNKDSVTTYDDGDADSKTDTQTSIDKAKDDVPYGGTGNGTPEMYDVVKLKKGTNYFSTSSGKKANGKSSKIGTTKKVNDGVYITDIVRGAAYPYRISRQKDNGAYVNIGYVRLYGNKDKNGKRRKNFTGYATGVENLLKNELAWTQEKGAEFIVRPSDGAILTPLAQGDSVLNAEASGNIWNMANSPADFIRENLGLDDVAAPSSGNVQNSIENNFDNIVFSLPSVTNYDEFVTAMTKDRNVERFVKSITTDLIAGKSKLAKGKSIR